MGAALAIIYRTFENPFEYVHRFTSLLILLIEQGVIGTIISMVKG